MPALREQGSSASDTHELASFTPAFVWLLRDFYLRLEDEQGRKVRWHLRRCAGVTGARGGDCTGSPGRAAVAKRRRQCCSGGRLLHVEGVWGIVLRHPCRRSCLFQRVVRVQPHPASSNTMCRCFSSARVARMCLAAHREGLPGDSAAAGGRQRTGS